MAGVHFNADFGLAIVRPEHQAFYRRVFLHKTWCEPRLYPGLVKPVGLMASHLPTVRERVLPVIRSCVRAPSSGGCCSIGRPSPIHRPTRPSPRLSSPPSFRSPDLASFGFRPGLPFANKCCPSASERP